ncbi:MAG: helix-turn-helix domain-containing protein [Herbinix sp.]|nr:helix-turn-helix domain-containing protein [Herbinix sp.]
MEVVLPMSKKDLASYLGTTPETISRKLADFEDAGYIVNIIRGTGLLI